MERECGDLPFGEYLNLPYDRNCAGEIFASSKLLKRAKIGSVRKSRKN
jgi:hypothetical protein